MPLHGEQLAERAGHVDGDADDAGLVGDGAGDRLFDPPHGVGGKLVAAAVFEFVHRFHEPDVSLLDEVGEIHPAMGVHLGDGDHEAQVGLGQRLLGLLLLGAPLAKLTGTRRQLGGARPGLPLEVFDCPCQTAAGRRIGAAAVPANETFERAAPLFDQRPEIYRGLEAEPCQKGAQFAYRPCLPTVLPAHIGDLPADAGAQGG